MSLITDIASRNRIEYQRDNFDAFLKKVGFHYDIPSIHRRYGILFVISSGATIHGVNMLVDDL